MDPNVILNRVLRLARLDTSVFDEVRDDQNETVPAVIIAAICAFLGGLGSFLWWKVVWGSEFEPDGVFLNTLLLGSIFTLAMYGVGALVIYVVLAQMFKLQVDLLSLVRVMGYAAIPMALWVLMFIPMLYPLFAIMPIALLMVMMIYAVQSVSGADSTEVVIASGVGLAVMVLVLGFFAQAGNDAPIGAGIFSILFDYS
ncbi:MAG: hypothetical protein IT302_10160 [Dehalococcoidia bacterium]|nr:hypothetical protein [Dehalococcoidia bacterium]